MLTRGGEVDPGEIERVLSVIRACRAELESLRVAWRNLPDTPGWSGPSHTSALAALTDTGQQVDSACAEAAELEHECRRDLHEAILAEQTRVNLLRLG